MFKKLLILCFSFFMLVSCKSEKEQELENQVEELEATIEKMKRKIAECNQNIDTAKSYAYEHYD